MQTSKAPYLFFALFAILYSLFTTPVFAETATPSVGFDVSSIGYSRLSPNSPLYFLKAVREIVELKLAATEKVKVLRYMEFAERRLAAYCGAS